MGEDDKAFAHYPISESVRICLISAGEHLRLVWDGLLQKNLYNSAQHTAVRGALVGAAQAVWILAPGDHQKTLDLAPQFGYSRTEKQQIAEQTKWIKSRRRALEAVQPELIDLNLTDVFRDVAPEVFSEHPKRQAGLRLAWNVLSSDAHVNSWAIATRAEFSETDKNSGLAVGVTGGHAAELAGWYSLSMSCLRHGWRVFDRRCEEE
ncbi:hypothetical protein [Nocardia neocaledoniensis]|uniref:hypothetical protein n=1 Tax=Nocardia neocaledoniensis TaxID=236511 RepID=UPI002457D8C1|nr:hypothetical protein [Nocardia neocaledoniensis]